MYLKIHPEQVNGVDAPFFPGYYESSAPKRKKTYCGKEKGGSRHLLRRLFSYLQLCGGSIEVWRERCSDGGG